MTANIPNCLLNENGNYSFNQQNALNHFNVKSQKSHPLIFSDETVQYLKSNPAS